ncbi:MAG: family 78 glycoside hydrolase catalytic domain, partial [Thermoguttaceae bacterium]|nr:family 78 glycoside hydrolase catalytic domain [Thermoguttaceae bacterium]
ALDADADYWWTVQIKDENGAESRRSPVAEWTTGLFDPDQWTAKWIGVGKLPDGETNPMKATNLDENERRNDPWLRKSFELDAVPARAQLFVATMGYHEIYVNGKRVGDAVLEPNVANYKYRARYVTYDLSPYLKAGKNVLAIWLGNGWGVYPQYATDDRPNIPLVKAQADLRAADGSVLRVETDASWKTAPSPNYLVGGWNFTVFGGEYYDAALEDPNWNAVDFDDSAWDNVAEFDVKREIDAQVTPANAVLDEIRPVKIEKKGDKTWRVDMGRNFAGWTEFHVKGKPGTEIQFQYSEREKEAMTFNLRSAYKIGPSGEGVFKNRFNYSSCRWITVIGLDEAPSLDDVRGWLVRTNYAELQRIRGRGL